MVTKAEFEAFLLQHQKWVEEENARKALLPKEYQVVYLDETTKLSQLEGVAPISETNDLHEALNMMAFIWESEGAEVAVWQPRTQGFRGYHKRKILPERDAKGRFVKS